jgi:hypothetical protein
MVQGLCLTASFGPNPFAASQGIYNGLFYETNLTARPQSSGYLTINIGGSGAYTGTIITGNSRLGISGVFDTSGQSKAVASSSQVVLTNIMKLNYGTNFSAANRETNLSGTVSGSNWSSSLLAFPQTAAPALASNYTLTMYTSESATNSPSGAGYAAVTVDSKGSITSVGHMPDGAAFSQQAALTAGGLWPFYSSLYSGSGSVFGWFQFVKNSGPTNLNSVWICPANASPLPAYSAGFTNSLYAASSPFSASAKPSLNLSQGTLVLGGGDLPQSITNQFTLDTNNVFAVTQNTNNIQITVNTNSGVLSGSFYDFNRNVTVPVYGTVLQKQVEAEGYFLGTNEGGWWLITK